jgi:hypothetical protein
VQPTGRSGELPVTREAKVILAPRSIRLLNFGILILTVLLAVFIAVYPPFRLVQIVLATAAAVIALIAAIRVLRAGYVLTPSTLKIRGIVATQSIPKREIAAFPFAGVVERRDHWGGTTNLGTVMFREDRLGPKEREAALVELRRWLAGAPQSGGDKPPS